MFFVFFISIKIILKKKKKKGALSPTVIQIIFTNINKTKWANQTIKKAPHTILKS
jgi:hypothetical protein